MYDDTVTVQLTAQQIDLLRGIIFEYYSQNDAYDVSEKQIRNELEIILADAETKLYFLSDLKMTKYSDIVSDGGMDPRNKFDTVREWVGLTDEEKEYFRRLGLVGVEIIEAKLKERNT